MNTTESQNYTILGQKYAYATVSLILGILCFVNLAGTEKAIMAIVFGWLALRKKPAPALVEHRLWAKAGLILGSLMLVILLIVIIINFDQIRQFIEGLSKMSNGK